MRICKFVYALANAIPGNVSRNTICLMSASSKRLRFLSHNQYPKLTETSPQLLHEDLLSFLQSGSAQGIRFIAAIVFS